ncbi:hypothetical protein [Pseudomonas sp. 1152_12]|uniref:hypothetical protein n=1 Tax=Pseudomonas sp. 1152_12 TaxID=2604455 RepID=UPI004062FB2F
MEQPFTESEQAYLADRVAHYVGEVVERVTQVICEAEAAANADFSAQGFTFAEHSPANADYLTVCLMEELFRKVHSGDMAMAELMLTMMAKQEGISLHVD